MCLLSAWNMLQLFKHELSNHQKELYIKKMPAPSIAIQPIIKGKPLNWPQQFLQQDSTLPFPRTCPAHKAGKVSLPSFGMMSPGWLVNYKCPEGHSTLSGLVFNTHSRRRKGEFTLPQANHHIKSGCFIPHERRKEKVTPASSIGVSINYHILERDNMLQQRLPSCIYWSDTMPSCCHNSRKIGLRFADS